MEVSPIVDETLAKACGAAAVFTQFDQAQVDRIVRAVFLAGLSQRVRLARMACEETGLGKWQDKVWKNVLATLYVYDDIKDVKTVGIIAEDPVSGITEIAQPLGPILAIIPVTNPTSTTLFKILIALKTRNPIIISGHHRATGCCREAVRICYEAALREDAPEDCIQFFDRGSREETRELMSDRRLALILATGGESVVKAAYSSSTPAIGVGAGNVPVFIERTADIPFAIDQILLSKTFDNGTVCASEQALVVDSEISRPVREELLKRKAHFLTPDEIRLLETVAYDRERQVMNADIIGQSVGKIAAMAGLTTISPDASILLAELDGIGDKIPLSSEILAPILAYYEADSLNNAVNLCIDINYHGGIGHTASIFSNDDEKIKQFALLMNAGRVLVNMPSSQGAVGGLFNTLPTSFTLGCGTGGKNITTDNVTARHLLNIQRICRRRVNERTGQLAEKMLFDENIAAAAIEKAYYMNY